VKDKARLGKSAATSTRHDQASALRDGICFADIGSRRWREETGGIDGTGQE
jgi:hypothetical protein